MSVLVVIATLALLAAVVVVISGPLRARAGEREDAARGAGTARADAAGAREQAQFERDQLEAAREAKYREIRDAELDYRTGKLSPEDYEAVDRSLRAEAIEILRRLDAAGADVTPRDA